MIQKHSHTLISVIPVESCVPSVTIQKGSLYETRLSRRSYSRNRGSITPWLASLRWPYRNHYLWVILGFRVQPRPSYHQQIPSHQDKNHQQLLHTCSFSDTISITYLTQYVPLLYEETWQGCTSFLNPTGIKKTDLKKQRKKKKKQNPKGLLLTTINN